MGSVTDLAAPADMWDRIRRGLDMPDIDGRLVDGRIKWYLSRPDYIQRMSERAGRYMFYIVEELERRHLPTELALLTFIESAFNPGAVSRTKAVGIWQFMPRTGKSFDLRQNSFRDERQDIVASTNAALDYLESLHTQFGDWHLALAAYNWGQGNVRRAIARNKRAKKPTGYLHLRMPAETRLYIPKLQAVEQIIRNPGAYGLTLPVIPNHPYFEVVNIDSDIDVALVAKLAGIEESAFRALNPALRQPVILANGTSTGPSRAKRLPLITGTTLAPRPPSTVATNVSSLSGNTAAKALIGKPIGPSGKASCCDSATGSTVTTGINAIS